MKLIYIFNAEIKSEKASVVQAVCMCDAFASRGIDVELVVPVSKIKNNFSYDYLTNRFGINARMELSFYKKIQFFNRLGIIGSYFGIKKYLIGRKADIYFTRCPMIFAILVKKKLPVIFESHNSKLHNTIKIFDIYWGKKVVRASQSNYCLVYIAISQNLSKFWSNKGVPTSKILSLHDGFNYQLFKSNINKIQARFKLNLPKNKKIIMYSGSLYPDREIENIISLAKHFSDIFFLIIGGPQENANQYQLLAKEEQVINIQFIGPIRHSQIPLYLYASDVLLALWSNKVPTINFCSPLKIFEYMAAGRVIVAHGFPTIREVIRHKQNGLLVEPDNFKDLVEKVKMALSPGNRDMEKQTRLEAFSKYTWDKRVNRILETLNYSKRSCHKTSK